jgi:hypothetical protein
MLSSGPTGDVLGEYGIDTHTNSIYENAGDG